MHEHVLAYTMCATNDEVSQNLIPLTQQLSRISEENLSRLNILGNLIRYSGHRHPNAVAGRFSVGKWTVSTPT